MFLKTIIIIVKNIPYIPPALFPRSAQRHVRYLGVGARGSQRRQVREEDYGRVHRSRDPRGAVGPFAVRPGRAGEERDPRHLLLYPLHATLRHQSVPHQSRRRSACGGAGGIEELCVSRAVRRDPRRYRIHHGVQRAGCDHGGQKVRQAVRWWCRQCISGSTTYSRAFRLYMLCLSSLKTSANRINFKKFIPFAP